MNTPQRVDVERFTQGDGYIAGNGEMIADAAGEWVRHSDYAALLQQLAEAERARDEAHGLLRDVIAWRRTVPIDETPNRKDGGIFGRIAALLAANK